MPTDSYKDYMYNAAKKKRALLIAINSLGRQIEGIDVLLEHSDLNDRETGILLKKRDRLYEEREVFIKEFYSL